MQRLYHPFEYPRKPESLFLFAMLLSLLGALNRYFFKDVYGAYLFVGVSVLNFFVWLYALMRRRSYMNTSADSLKYCKKMCDNSIGETSFDVKTLTEEKILYRTLIDGKAMPMYRLISGLLMMVWGILLSGLPVTMMSSGAVLSGFLLYPTVLLATFFRNFGFWARFAYFNLCAICRRSDYFDSTSYLSGCRWSVEKFSSWANEL